MAFSKTSFAKVSIIMHERHILIQDQLRLLRHASIGQSTFVSVLVNLNELRTLASFGVEFLESCHDLLWSVIVGSTQDFLSQCLITMGENRFHEYARVADGVEGGIGVSGGIGKAIVQSLFGGS